ncbi:MAG: lactate dehydrogenase [Pseudomonadaceae bacterium]|nr:lactate dehydrogenase [Pseudomonadaceae bacterium]
MNAVEIEEAISSLAEQPFDAEEFPYAFLQAFGNKATTIRRLRSGSSNKSDMEGVLQTNNIHIKACPTGEVTQALSALKDSPATKKAKAKFALATDGIDLEAEDLNSGETVACTYANFPDHFGFFLPLAGISTVSQIRESSFDIKATGRLNRLYVELLKDNPDWGTADRRPDMNHFMARLIFCFFAEDTDIFSGEDLFTGTIDQMSERDASNTYEVISKLFEAMNTKFEDREAAELPRWANRFPYVNGGLFSGSTDVPRFSKIARSYLLHIGNLDWQKINPDIFGSMIQAVADDEERGALGMHYTSVPNILKVLNPLFLDDLREKLEEAGDNSRKLLNLRNRIAKIRVFDPACGSGNFLVIAYKEMRAIEAKINERRGEREQRTVIPLTNFRGIELRDFPAEIARLALIIAEYQCDLLYRGQKEALADFLPLDAMNWITCGNALRLDWLSICPPTGTGVKHHADDLFHSPLDQAQIDFENEGGETYICGNPPYLGSTWQSAEQKADLDAIFSHRTKSWKTLDYVAGWFMKATDFGFHTKSSAAFVSTKSICQGQQVAILWPQVFATEHEINFAHTSFKWSNLASHKAGVTVVIVGLSNHAGKSRQIYSLNTEGESVVREVSNINAYLVAAPDLVVQKASKPLTSVAAMSFGNKPVDGGNLLLSGDEVDALNLTAEQRTRFIRRIYGAAEFIQGKERYVLWIDDEDREEAMRIEAICKRVEGVRKMRLASRDKSANEMAKRSHQMREMNIGQKHTIAIPAISSENRPYLPCGLLGNDQTVTNKVYALYDAPLWNLALIASRLHWVWIGTVCVRMRTDFSYSNTLGWNTFPIPKLTDKNREDLTRCAEDILLTREAHYPATIADLYDPENMPDDLREAHDRNDEVLERIYIGRRFRNDTERLEKLFELYTKMTTDSVLKKTNSRKKA